ncbi:MAG: glycosyltransferase [Myxococcales bacterium]|nr:glycosyltransferase [Myxococcales bacterium]
MTTPITSLEVVIFSYNFARFLPDALAGVAAQTRQPDAWIVSDDCSPKDTPAELAAIVAPFPGAKLLHTPHNMGPVAHFRHRIAQVQSDAYLLLSGDDYLVDPGFLQQASDILAAEPDINVVFGHHLSVDQDGRATVPERPAADAAWTRLNGTALRAQLAYENVVPAVCSVIRTSVHDKIPPFPLDSPTRHDWQQWYLMTYHGDFARIEKTVIHYRAHGDNISVGAAQSLRMAATVGEAYTQLMARPECTEEDRRHLRAGLNRIRLRGARIAELPGVVAGRIGSPGLGLALAETLAERGGRRLSRLSTDLRRKFLKRQTGESW